MVLKALDCLVEGFRGTEAKSYQAQDSRSDTYRIRYIVPRSNP